jgi:hypothetical protein
MVEPSALVQAPRWAQPMLTAMHGWQMATQQSQQMTMSRLKSDYHNVKEKELCSSQATGWWSEEGTRMASMQEVTGSAEKTLRWRGYRG